ncbi:aldo/keto reductase [Hoeflea prorocentri]|uniref:Aldo/keto reductase n=1 Tax=Hoeflea prorocentri TaxID=1922333 RepID=A0A9X3UL66_9HYPH|nr:aldo/keto reductase [Hoeflea prorocentri]MCY6382601.1 aldo/keto reductase [Hoeflea prorocentri]MDA5400401.1 aldo/keto reductase [Hoeflea prorocentri]
MSKTATLRPGYSFSRIIKGGWQLAGDHGPVDRARSVADMERFLDAGITTFDCADIYVGVEEMIGEFIDRVRGNRGSQAADEIKVHTKLVPDFDRLETVGPADIEAIVDRSLRRLRLDQLPLVQFYWWDLSIGRPHEVLDCLKDIQRRGKIRLLGTTNWDEAAMEPFISAGFDLASTQVQYSLLDNRPAGDFARWCGANAMQILAYGSLAGGFLTEKWLGTPDPGHTFSNRSLVKYRLIIDEFGGWDLFQVLMKVLKSIAGKHGVTLSAVASRWVLDQPGVGAVIIGARTADRLSETTAIFDLALDDEDRKAIGDVLGQRFGPEGPVYGLERDKTGRHGRIMKYNLGTAS